MNKILDENSKQIPREDCASGTKDKLASMFRYLFPIFMLSIAFGIATNNFTVAIVWAIASFLVLLLLREKFIPKFLRHPLFKISLLVIALFLSANISNKISEAIKEREQAAIVEAERIKKEELFSSFTANPQPILDEITNLIDSKKFDIARDQINYYKEVENEQLKALDIKLLKIKASIEEELLIAEKKAEEERRKAQAAALWSYSHRGDQMSKGVIRHASILSSNTVNFNFPYSGTQHGTLTLRDSPRYGKDVIISIEKGQILCPSYDGCTVLVRFDDENPSRYSALPPEDNSTETIFIQNYSRFVAKMMRAKRVRISLNIYQEGSPVFDFNVSGFNRDAYQPKE
jgi:hypothetical protein